MFFRTFIPVLCAALCLSVFVQAQHPDRLRIDSLKQRLPFEQGIRKVDCLNALSEEYWWSPRIFPDSVSCWAEPAYREAIRIHYTAGIARSLMHLGVAEVCRKNFLTAERSLRQGLEIFRRDGNTSGTGWSYVWLGQTLYAQNRFPEAIQSYRTSLPYLEEIQDWEGKGKAWAWMGFLFSAMGEYDSSFEYCNKSLLIRQRMKDDVCVAAALTNMGHLYKVAGAIDDALDFFRQGWQYAKTHTINLKEARWNYMDEPLGMIYWLSDKPDSSLRYLHNALTIDPENMMTLVSLGETYLSKKLYDSALAIFLKPVQRFRRQNNRWDLMRILLNAAKAYEGKQDHRAALPYAREGFAIARDAGVKQFMMDGYLVLSRIYKQLHQNDSAYRFLQQYIELKESVMRGQLVWRLSNYKRQADFKKQQDHIALLDKDISIKKEKIRRDALMKWILAACLLVATLSAYYIYNNLRLKRKNEKLQSRQKQAELQQHVTELEMEALRAQMNPHFIFNCLSSINRFILKNETETASDYLTKFSRLIRMVLTYSRQSFISLEDELEMLRLYMDMERLRFREAFDYHISFSDSVEPENIFVPPMLLQPFAENAIWHGLMHKEGHGQLEIELSLQNKLLTCSITDNGIGREKAKGFQKRSPKKQKSMGLQITKERLALLNRNADVNTFFRIEDLVDNQGLPAGTRVVLKMNVPNMTEVVSET